MGFEFHVSARTTFLSLHQNSIISQNIYFIFLFFSFSLFLKKSRNKISTIAGNARIDGCPEPWREREFRAKNRESKISKPMKASDATLNITFK